jgi:biofilm protein TabA
MEAHETFVDVQCLIRGEEKILFTDKTALPTTVPYSAEKDAAFHSFTDAEAVTYKAGECVVLYPVEAHLPNRAVNEPMAIKKAVMKVNFKKLTKKA